jgi:cytochrome c oxidase subunit 4
MSQPIPAGGEPLVNDSDSSTSDHAHLHVTVKGYLTIFGLLMVLLALTVAAAFLPHFGYLSIIIAMLIAFIKATVVVLYFMHVKFSSRLTMIFVVSMMLWLGILFIFTFGDYFTRSWDGSSRGWVDSPVRIEQEKAPAEHAPSH